MLVTPTTTTRPREMCVAAVERALRKQTAHKNVFVPEGKVPKLTEVENTD